MSDAGAWSLSPGPATPAGRRTLLLRLDVPGRQVNVLTASGLRELEARAEEIRRERPAGVVLISGKAAGFCAGADVDAIAAVRTAAEGEEAAAAGQRAFRRLTRVGCPVVAAIHGACVGGGLELALWCGGRVAAADDRTRLGLPEVRLGIVPGFGGTQLLPRLVGLAAAVDLAASGRLLSPRQALARGLVDAVAPFESLLPEALRLVDWLGEAGRPSPIHLVNLPLARDLVAAVAAGRVRRQARGRYPAPPEAVRLCRRALSLDLEQGLALEARALGRLVVSDVSRHLQHLHRATTAAGRSGQACPAEALLGVVGAGVMGAAVAGLAAARGHSARVRDVAAAALGAGAERAEAVVRRALRRAARPAHAVARALDRISYTTGPGGFGHADLVLEAVVERPEVKRQVLAEMESVVADDCLLATNTSSLSVADLAASLRRPERFLGLHFFNPVARMPLVEIVPGPATSPEAVSRARGWARALGKVPVVAGDQPGFLVNRLLMPYLAEALAMHEEGIDLQEIDAAAVAFGLPMGPFALLDEVGLDVALEVARTFARAFPERFREPASLAKLVALGRLGNKAKAGFYEASGRRRRPWKGLPRPRATAPREEVADRLLLPIADEVARCLHEGVAAAPDDIDVASVLGMGFPPFRGGAHAWLRERGAAAVAARLRDLAGRHGARLAPSEALLRLADGGG